MESEDKFNIYDKLKIRNKLIKAESDFENVDRLILPGVGAFDSAIEMLKKSKLYNKIDNLVVNDQFKILGICVGMQIMSNSSEEELEPTRIAIGMDEYSERKNKSKRKYHKRTKETNRLY